MKFSYDIIVIGAGHAGCEAAAAAANLGSDTLLITMDMNKIAQMSCNPAVGGIAKGQIVREIDALGGQMGIVTDETAIQFRMLNRSKGAAMWSPRSQSDRVKFSLLWRHILENTPNLSMWQDSVNQLIVEDATVRGVKTSLGVTFKAKAVVLTAGTFLNGLIHIGRTQVRGGRISEPASYGITEQLRDLGFVTDRMKTGTPVRIDARSVDFSQTAPQDGDNDFHKFSYLPSVSRKLPQKQCFTVYTSEKTHDILRAGLPDSPLFNGQIKSIGPRYCPSIETKIVTFADKTEHQLFLEPEGLDTQEYYLNGFSSSLPLVILAELIAPLKELFNSIEEDRRDEIIEAAEILMKYDGYIVREKLVADKIRRLEDIKLSDKFDYASISSLSTEARQKLEKLKPLTIAQASRIPGVSPADINILLLMLGR